METGRKGSAGHKAPTVSECRFVTAAEGTVVYGPDGRFIGLYETEDAAVEMIRLRIEQSGGNNNAI